MKAVEEEVEAGVVEGDIILGGEEVTRDEVLLMPEILEA